MAYVTQTSFLFSYYSVKLTGKYNKILWLDISYIYYKIDTIERNDNKNKNVIKKYFYNWYT